MINKIIKAAADNIKEYFEDINVYTEEVKQGFEKPCFSIICSAAQSNLFRGQRYRMKADIEIHYYSDTREDNNNVMLQLFEILDCINVDDFPLRAVKKEMIYKDDYYLLKLGFDFFYYIKEETELMGEYMEKLNITGQEVN